MEKADLLSVDGGEGKEAVSPPPILIMVGVDLFFPFIYSSLHLPHRYLLCTFYILDPVLEPQAQDQQYTLSARGVHFCVEKSNTNIKFQQSSGTTKLVFAIQGMAGS